MSYYGVVFGSFWDGPTGRAIKRDGGADAQLLGSYLMTAPTANMLGLFFLPVDAIHDHVAITRLRLVRAFGVLEAEDFAHYDTVTQFAWVVEMARFRCGIKAGQAGLKPGDNKVLVLPGFSWVIWRRQCPVEACGKRGAFSKARWARSVRPRRRQLPQGPVGATR